MFTRTSGTLIAAAVVALWSSTALGQDDPQAELTLGLEQQQTLSNGVSVPLPTVVDRADALSLELNPAGLAHIQGAELIYVQAQTPSGIGQGGGAFMAAGTNGFGFGFGAQFLSDALGTETGYRKFTLGVGGGDRLSFGLNYNFMDGELREVDDYSAWDLGLQLRATSWLGLAATFRDLNTPFLGDAEVTPQSTVGLALRLWDGRFLLEPTTTIFADTRRMQPRFMAALEPFSGVRLFGQVLTDTGPDGDNFEFVEATAGLQLNLAYLGLTGAGIFGDASGGFSGALRLSSARWRSPSPGSKRFYKVVLRGELPERAQLDFLGRIQGRSFLDLQRQLAAMRDDPTVGGVLLDITGLEMGFGQLWELRQSLSRLRDRGIPIVAYLHTTTYRDYYLASVADKVFMGPSGTFNARGLSSQRMYYRQAFDKLGVEPDFLRIGDYKSAPESYTRTGPTPAADEALNAFLDDVWEVQIGQIAAGRGLEPRQVDALIDAAPHTPDAARSEKLVDRVLFPDELEDALKELYGANVRVDATYQRRERDYSWSDPPRIAVIYVDGTIIRGKSGANPLLGDLLVGDETITQATERLLKDRRYVGAVIRIDSPGGSATGSDLMYRSLKKLADKKPVVVSMGDIAASGGYYAAAAGNEIYCTPTTLTGSIGIFSGKFALRGLFQLIGLNRVTVKRGDQADLYNLDDPWTPKQREIIQGQIDYLYDRFLSIVADGRDFKKERADELGRGRIWSGVRAKDNALCDTHGGLLDAIERVREKAGLKEGDPYDAVSFPSGNILSPISMPTAMATGDPADLLDGPFIPDLPADVSDAELFEAYAPLRALLKPLRPALDLALTFEDGESLALMPFVVDWE